MTFKVGDRVRCTNLSVDKLGTWQDCKVIRLPSGSGIFFDVKNLDGVLGLLKASEMELIPPTPSTATERLERLEALARKVAEFHFYNGMDIQSEARSLVAELTPVDGDLVEARECVAAAYRDSNMPGLAENAIAGRMDHRLRVKAALAAIKRGRALERGEP